jgi:hypothetical protein
MIGPDELKLWDGSAGWWINPRADKGYGTVVAVRIETGSSGFADGLRWGKHVIKPDQWVQV